MPPARRYALNKSKYLLDPELQNLEDLLKRFSDTNLRDCLLIEVCLRTGGRAQEVLNIKNADLDPYEQTVLLRGLKGSNDREIPLKPELFQRLKRFADSQAGPEIFDITYNRLRQIWGEYRPTKKKLHCLRHTFAIQLYKKTRDIRLVQVALGHRNVMNTMVYADYMYTQTELRRLIL